MPMPPELEVRVVSRIAELLEQDWKSVFPQVLESYRFFKTLDESNLIQFSFFYVLVYDNGLPIGATSCFIMDFPIDIAAGSALKGFLGFVRKIIPRIFTIKAMICGLPMGQGRIGIIKDTERVMGAMQRTFERIAKEKKAPLMIFKDFNSSYDAMLKPLIREGYLRMESFPSTDMEVNFGSFEDYLKGLSPSSRENLRRNFKKIDGKVKIELAVKNKLEGEELAAVHALYLQTYNKQEMGLEKLTPDFFRRIAQNMPEETKFFLWKVEDKIAAFAFCLVSGDYFIDYYLGFDYAVAHRYFLYFMRFRGLLKWCIEHGIKTYEMGVTTYEPKKRLGFYFIRLYFYIKHRNKLINRFSGLLVHLLKPENFDAIFEHMDNAGSVRGA